MDGSIRLVATKSDRAQETPEAEVREIESKAQNWSEPSQASETRYVRAFNLWLGLLPENKRSIARKILADAHKPLAELREAIRNKKAELASISFDQSTSPRELSRLGVELQTLQAALYNRLNGVSRRMKEETGLEMGRLDPQSMWLLPPTLPAQRVN